TCRKLHLPESDCQEIFRRMVFNHLANNTDDHNKNFSFIMTPDGQWRLSPAYDMTFIFDLGGYLPSRDHCIFTRGKLSGLTLQDALDFAKENGIRRPESIIRKVAGSIVRFREFATECGAADEWIGRVETCLDSNLKAWGFK
ncbi:MAG: HipA domain-containing protein, partial [Bacteroidaceae bacterium]|nr:HipA domain-containing protein [Bacteroidaceae bacterium]